MAQRQQWDNPYNWAEVAEIVALEMSKYLTKEASMDGKGYYSDNI